jgi:hypothetical protein
VALYEGCAICAEKALQCQHIIQETTTWAFFLPPNHHAKARAVLIDVRTVDATGSASVATPHPARTIQTFLSDDQPTISRNLFLTLEEEEFNTIKVIKKGLNEDITTTPLRTSL